MRCIRKASRMTLETSMYPKSAYLEELVQLPQRRDDKPALECRMYILPMHRVGHRTYSRCQTRNTLPLPRYSSKLAQGAWKHQQGYNRTLLRDGLFGETNKRLLYGSAVPQHRQQSFIPFRNAYIIGPLLVHVTTAVARDESANQLKYARPDFPHHSGHAVDVAVQLHESRRYGGSVERRPSNARATPSGAKPLPGTR